MNTLLRKFLHGWIRFWGYHPPIIKLTKLYPLTREQQIRGILSKYKGKK